jgi:methyl-accepting chemotaxis protein
MNNSQSNMLLDSVSTVPASEYEDDDTLRRAGDLCHEVLPIWAEQIGSARETTNTAIESLSQRFYDLSKRIEITSGVSSEHDHSNDLVGLLKESQTQLSSVITLLHHAVEDKKTLVNAIIELSQKSKELNGLANIVKSIARETNMVAINAAIEAAHIGQLGSGFAVVASAVRRLSGDAERTGNNISEVVNNVAIAINKVEAISHEYEEKDSQMVIDAEQVVQSVVTKFGEATQVMTASTQAMQTQGQHIKSEIADVLVSLQFQDRVSQMLTHVQDDIYKLHDRISSNGEIDNEQWMDELSATYTTKEQHQIHRGKPHTLSKPSAIVPNNKVVDSNSDDITFF